MSLPHELPACWRAELGSELEQPYFAALARFVTEERASGAVFPPPQDVFAAFERTPFERVRAVIVGQDPYHGDGQAHGLCFSVRPGVAIPPSLRNIFKELESDLGIPRPAQGDLAGWAAQGVLLLNTTLTVRAGAAASHQGRGWETFTDAVIRLVAARPEPVAFVLWGAAARRKRPLVAEHHLVVESAHPSPLSASNGFFGSRPFSRIDEFLASHGRGSVVWGEPDSAGSVG
jgi:uracil-DNA glycosylase